ncbi:MAG TPA: amino acid--tRNA ligase-related protein, partial [Chlamydiales bacterium]|nr:amino acid--tRNA ligase-related protein [Chlamydiales bacterium]
YRDAFTRYVGIDPMLASDTELQKRVPETIGKMRDDCLDYLLTTYIEPHLGKEGCTVLAYYPPTQAALAKTRPMDGVTMAERFEVYRKGIELANGYHELQDAKEQRKRLNESNLLRQLLGKDTLPIDERFLAALESEKGLPECSGVAVGFDRLMMLRQEAKTISEVIAFSWQQA